jgi:hypothetical protein
MNAAFNNIQTISPTPEGGRDEVTILHTRQPINAYGPACAVAPELDELLY